MANITFKTYVAANATPQFKFASRADTTGTSDGDTFTAPSGWTATTIGGGEVVITKNTSESTAGGKTYTFNGIGWGSTAIAFPKQTVTRLTDTDQFMNPYLEYTPSIETHVNDLTGKDCLIFKFENDYVGLRSTETIKLIKGKTYTLASNMVDLDCDLLSGTTLTAGDLLGTYDFTFTGGSGTFEVVNFNKLNEDGDLDWSDDFVKKTMLSSKHKIDSSSYDKYNSNPIYNKRSHYIQLDNNFKFHGVGDFAGYTKLQNFQGPSGYTFEAIDLKYVFAGYKPARNPLVRNADFSAVTSMEGFLSGATNYVDAINFPTALNSASSSITNMSYMLEYVNDLKGISNGISGWNTANVTSMEGLLEGSSISSRYIGSWNVSKVTNFKAFLKNNREWNASVRGFRNKGSKGLGVSVASSITMESFFENSIYNQEIGPWKLDKVHNVNKMFKNSAYTGKTWNFGIIGEDNLVTTVTADAMWEGTIWNPDAGGKAGAGNWFKYPSGTGKVTSIKNIFKDSEFGPLSGGGSHYINSWNTESVTDMEGAFQNSPFNGQLKKWDVGEVLTMKSMFEDAEFNQHIRNWQPAKVATLENFAKNADFNQPIASWNSSLAGTLKNADGAFSGAESAFNQNIAGWNGVLQGAKAGEGHHTIFDGNAVVDESSKPAVVKTAEAEFQEDTGDTGDTGGDGDSGVYVEPVGNSGDPVIDGNNHEGNQEGTTTWLKRPTISWTHSGLYDGVDGFTISIVDSDNNPVDSESTPFWQEYYTLTIDLSAGNYTAKIKAVDSDGNSSESTDFSFDVSDSAPTEIPVITKGTAMWVSGGNKTADFSPVFVLSGANSEYEDTYALSFDDGPYSTEYNQNNADDIRPTFSTLGEHTIKVKLKRGSNLGLVVGTITFDIVYDADTIAVYNNGSEQNISDLATGSHTWNVGTSCDSGSRSHSETHSSFGKMAIVYDFSQNGINFNQGTEQFALDSIPIFAFNEHANSSVALADAIIPLNSNISLTSVERNENCLNDGYTPGGKLTKIVFNITS